MRKETRKYFFSVEGKTEKWYLEWLQRMINDEPSAFYFVKLDCQVQRDPIKRAKSIPIIGKVQITHVFDYESEEPSHGQQFRATLDRMKDAQDIGKSIKYVLGYSNFAFELWIVLHKADCRGALVHRRHYLGHLNRAYDEGFESLDEYKQEDGFRRVLAKLTLGDVRQAIRRAEAITQRNQADGCVLQQYKGYEYYRENPSLSVWESIRRILDDCGLLEACSSDSTPTD